MEEQTRHSDRLGELDLRAAGVTRVVVVVAHPDEASLAAGGVVARAQREGIPVVLVADTDGTHVAADEDRFTTRLVEVVGDGRDTLLVAPRRHDGRPDHEAAGRAAARAAYRTGARLLADSLGPEEAYAVQRGDDDSLDRLHAATDDPWGVDTRWYERRKRDLTLAALPRERFRRALEVGCSTGGLAADLAGRADELLAIDRSEHAVTAARRRLAGRDRVRVEQRDAPDDWPGGEFDLVVVSEVGYFLSPRRLDRLVDHVADCMAPDGALLLCHWRHEIVGWPLSGPDVHARFARASLPPESVLPPVSATYADRDVEIVVHCAPEVLPDPMA